MESTLRSRLLVAWMAWVLPRPYLVLGLCFALAVASVVYTALFLDFKTSQLELISPSNPLVGLSKRLKPFEGKDSFTVVIEAPTPHEAVRFLEKLVQRLEGDQTHYKDIFYRVDPQLMRPWALLYLEGKEIQDIEERIQDYPTLVRGILQRPDLENFLELVNREMTSRMVGALFTDFLKLDGDMQQGEIRSRPMDLGFLIKVLEGMESYLSGSPSYRSPWTAFFREGSWDRDLEGYFWAADKRFLLFFVTPRLEKATFLRGKASLEHLRGLINEVGSGFPDVRVGVTGQEALRTDEMSVALGDMSWATWISFAGVWALMVVFFRSEGRTFIRMISMVVGMCWTFGWATLFVGHLNILSMVFAPLLVGIGVDYGIHWFARMEEEERQPSRSVQDVILTVAKNSGPGILIAGISAGVSFIPFVLTGFQGLVELGLISGVGILIHLLADFTVLPTLSLLVGRPKRRRNQAQHSARRSNLLRWDRKRAGWVLAGAVGLSLASLILGTKVSFDLNPLNLQARGTESVEWALRLQEGSNRSVLYASSLAGSLEELQVKSAAFKALPTVWKTQSVLSLLPEKQDTKAQLLRSISQGLPPPDSSAQGVVPRGEVIRDLLERIRFKMDDSEADKWGASRPLVEQIASVRSLTGRILDALGSSEDAEKVLAEYQGPFRDDILDAFDLIRQAAQSRPMGVDDLPPALKDRFWRDGQFLIRIFPSENIWEPGPRDRFVAELRSVDPQVAGDAVTLHEFTDDFRSATVRAALYALAGNFLLLLLTFRRWTQPLMALVPVLAGVLWILGAMGLLGIDFNLANSIYLPLVVGAGTEYGIILLHRWREGGMDPGGLPRSTAKGVILAELTTTVGFGSLMICRHKGIFSLGALAFAGSFCVLGAAVLVLPAILAYVRMPGHDSGGRETMRFVRRTFGFLVVCACFPVVLCWGAQSGRGPKGEVASILERAMDVQTDPALEGLQGRPKRASLIRKLIDENFLSSDMAAEALGDLWKDLGPPQKEEFTELFVELFQDSYTRMVLNFLRREELEYPEERVDGDKALVRTKIKRPNEHIPVDYHMVRKNGRWWIVDVDIDGVSIVGNYRNTFGRFLASQPLERLLERMRLQRQAVREAS